MTHNNGANLADDGTALVLDDVSAVEVGATLKDNAGGDTFTVSAINTATKTVTIVRAGGAQAIANNAVIQPVNEGADLVTGGAGNDVITFETAQKYGTPDRWIAVGATTAAPYSGINNGTDTVTFDAGALGAEFDLDPLSSVTGTGTGTNGWLTVTQASDLATADSAGNAVDPIQAAGTGNADVNGRIVIYDHDIASGEMTKAQLVTQFKNGGSNDALDMTANGAGIVVAGDETGSKVQIFWVDSALDGDGTDVTVSDVHELVISAGAISIDALTVDQFLV